MSRFSRIGRIKRGREEHETYQSLAVSEEGRREIWARLIANDKERLLRLIRQEYSPGIRREETLEVASKALDALVRENSGIVQYMIDTLFSTVGGVRKVTTQKVVMGDFAENLRGTQGRRLSLLLSVESMSYRETFWRAVTELYVDERGRDLVFDLVEFEDTGGSRE